ncbi:MAG: FAD-binding oxidoreductase [Candidatus Jordarchaeum sp.]|uniref:FAD-binding oxidoreductase n=1 Tax=Candidatus Jordarchaeum sp. TaxID=2823881 RepID=UPI00404B6426
MVGDQFLNELVEIVGRSNVSREPEVLDEYSRDLSFAIPKTVFCVVWPRSVDEVSRIVESAVKDSCTLIPVSSGTPRLRGDTTPIVDNSVIVDLSKMNKILRVDRKNRVVMVEPGVTFSQLLSEANKHGLRLLMPLLPKASKSVLASSLEREPVTMPKYHWDSSDPLLCTEVVFGTGDVFRTGAAAGPGNLEEQLESGGAQKSPMGPTQFDPFRILQGAQGTMGIVTWATIKCEILPDARKLFFAGSDLLEDFLDFAYSVLRRRLGDELFILNNVNLATILRRESEEILSLRRSLPKWILILCISGHGKLAQDELEYLEGDIKDIARETGVNILSEIEGISNKEVLDLLDKSCEEPYWKLRFRGGCQEVFFLTTLDKTPELYKTFTRVAIQERYPSEDVGVYIQPLVQGCNCHCEFDIYYNPSDAIEVNRAKYLYTRASEALLKEGAFFSRPYGPFTEVVYRNCSPETVVALRKVKSIFDPKNLLNPGKLCFGGV